jgi:uncharacterized RDD family membrane protein YckC
MSSTPQGGAPGEWSSAPPPHPAQDQLGAPQRGVAAQAAPGSPVPREQTRVTGRRVIQYLLDAILSSIIPAILYWALDRGHGGLHALGITVAAVLAVLWYAWYWVVRPHRRNGQTFGMQLFDIRIISKDGGPAAVAQLVIRWLLLIIDDLVVGLVGLAVILLSRQRQRVGDHLARTLVVRAGWQPAPGQVRPAAAARHRRVR